MRHATRGALWNALGPLRPSVLAGKRWVGGLLAARLSKRPAIFDDRGRGHATLLIVLAGHKPALWPKV
ncbi:MAG: hypothetical protein KY444_03985, partial [Gemmatimonadetes bacterium]|nr:hypothetical protein [Gemmatimonadota bacterium]